MRIALTGLVVATLAALAGTAGANGRDPYASTINFHPTNPQHIMAGMTFGLIRSTDGGATWQWFCEKTVGYGGTYDPDYAYSSTGAVFATTFDGLTVMRDGCSFTATAPGTTFVSRVERGPDNAIYFSASSMTPLDTKIYKSTDDGVTFPIAANPGMPEDWWQSIIVARSDAQRVYLSGYRLPKRCTQSSSNPGTDCEMDNECPGGMCEPEKDFLLFKSTNGGTSYTPMAMTGINPISINSAIDLLGTDPTDEDILYARVTLENTTSGDSIYKSTDAGMTWTKLLSKSSNIGTLNFLVRNDGSCVAGTRDMGAWKSPYVTGQGCSATWTDLVGAPHIGCLYESASNEVWACTQNTASPQFGITSDGYGIMKSADLTTWTGVLRFEDVEGPVRCAAGTVQEDQCVQRYNDMGSQWCCLITQLGITDSPIDCSGLNACFAMPEPAPDNTTMVKPPPDPCCGSANGPSSMLLTLLVASALLLRRRKPNV